ncbi:fimbrial protein [Chromobacterium amazonense]|uniref:fimbrial protein n=1 Tax=Chromobacterium amazonense TaxID=1382803 RepID=UPI003F7A377C
MKKLVFAGSLMAVAASSVFAAAGTLDVNGEIVTAACGVDPQSSNLVVNLGKVPTHVFKKGGDRSSSQNFDIKLTQCDTSTLKTVAVRFAGAAAPGNTQLMATTGSASGVGVRLQNATGELLQLGQYGSPINLVDGTNTLRFTAAYEALGDSKAAASVKPGTANGHAEFDLNYQ